jgi:hypothetical protein
MRAWYDDCREVDFWKRSKSMLMEGEYDQIFLH